jgi:hypothetical protein
LDQKPTAEIRSVAEGACAGERALTGGTGSVSDRGEESVLTERANARGETDGYRGPRGSEPFDQDRTEGGVRGGPKGSEPFD